MAPTTDPAVGPIRTCIGCRQRRPMSALVRIVRHDDGTVAIGRSLDGRGAWLCAGSTICARTAVDRRAVARALRGPVTTDSVEALVTAITATGARHTGSQHD